MNPDDQIDDLLASRPLKASDDFADRVMAEADARGLTPQGRSPSSTLSPAKGRSLLLRFALPVAAAIALSFAAVQMLRVPAAVEQAASTLSEAEITEILLLEEGVAGLSSLLPDEVQPSALGPTFDTLTFELEES